MLVSDLGKNQLKMCHNMHEFLNSVMPGISFMSCMSMLGNMIRVLEVNNARSFNKLTFAWLKDKTTGNTLPSMLIKAQFDDAEMTLGVIDQVKNASPVARIPMPVISTEWVEC